MPIENKIAYIADSFAVRASVLLSSLPSSVYIILINFKETGKVSIGRKIQTSCLNVK